VYYVLCSTIVIGELFQFSNPESTLMIRLEQGTPHAIRSFLAEKGLYKPIRIDLHFSGCCDPSLGLSLDAVHESDLIQELEGLTFVMSADTYRRVGDVTISHVDSVKGKGFVLTSAQPVSEWEGFCVTDIKI
jgi:Fe-S cluster assembly iron-binding protein IscA